MKTIVTIISLFLLLLTACKRSESTSTPDQVPVAARSIRTADAAANSLNPYDSIGKMHNIILAALHQYLSTGGDTGFAAQCNYVHNASLTIWGTGSSILSPTQILSLAAAIKSDYPKALDQYKMTGKAKDYLTKLIRLIKATTGKESYKQFKEKIMAFEQTASDDKTLSVREQRSVLCAASVARYSIYFWVVRNGKTEEPMETNGLFGKILGAIAAAVSDAAGAAIFTFVEARLSAVVETVSTLSQASWNAVNGAIN